MAKSMAMKVKVKNPQTKFKAMKVKGKVQHVQKAEDEAQKVAEAQQAGKIIYLLYFV